MSDGTVVLRDTQDTPTVFRQRTGGEGLVCGLQGYWERGIGGTMVPCQPRSSQWKYGSCGVSSLACKAEIRTAAVFCSEGCDASQDLWVDVALLACFTSGPLPGSLALEDPQGPLFLIGEARDLSQAFRGRP